MQFLSHEELIGLKQYKYKACGYTVLDDIHNPVWTWLVNRLPIWLAPNLITLLASASILISFMINICYLPGFKGEAPQWVYLVTAISVVLYVNLDCMDGKQARRTGSSSPLGQLFDHGCDALVLHMMLGNIAASLGVSCGWRMAAGCLGILAPWMLAQWEEYHTGVMVYGTRFYGVLEANYSICVVHLVTGLFGPAIWRHHVAFPTVFQGLLGDGMSLADLSLIVVATAGVAQGCHNVHRVLVQPLPPLPEEERGSKHVGRVAASRQLMYLLVVCLLGGILMHLAEGRGALEGRLAFSTFGVLYALTATQLIIAHMCKQPLQAPLVPILLLALGVANTLALKYTSPHLIISSSNEVSSPAPSTHTYKNWVGSWLLSQRDVTVVVAVVSWLWYSTYVLVIINQICEYLDVQVLSISKVLARNAATAAAEAEAKDMQSAVYHATSITEGADGVRYHTKGTAEDSKPHGSSRLGGSEVDALSSYSSPSSHSGSDKEE
ncbi:hypothetical protein CEUSTIGMA_g3786.t1 [Chlamydomonas eustigma]|uniref:Uncharacterized protein n=1 Tax=Chlamydomonas eustigma TaxID=1157962 RepID=A0A250X0R3_9CHLO|nr:hypothetical protein CEUSTIGMA_g3786.t1 [Chlamydomonas eustigma]|eukprot:GAX76340.1 hypothetical protein CEUSTIGMA_g3786.t1 [Chlamydomonas eustigma]